MITVLMATYNGSQFITKQLDSIRNQTMLIDKVILLDDCSTDDTVIKINNYIEKYSLHSWKVYQNEVNFGHYRTFIELVKLVDEGIVFFSDQDDIWDYTKIETMLPAFEKEQVVMAFCKSRFIDENDEIISSPDPSGSFSMYSVQNLFKSWPSGYQTAFKAEVLRDIIDKNFHMCPSFQFHDVLFGMLSCIYGNIIKIDTVLDSHRIHLYNVTRSAKSSSFHNSLSSRLDYYLKMSDRYSFIFHVANNMNNEKVEKIANHYYELYSSRYKFIKNWDVQAFFKMYKFREYYNGSRAFGSDMIYALRLNNFFGMLAEKMRRK